MCQVNETLIGDGPVTGYRIYEPRKVYGKGMQECSFFNNWMRPELNVKTEASSGGPFHACQSLDDVRSMLNFCISPWDTNPITNFVKVYRCELSGDIKTGFWSDKDRGEDAVKTYTGNYCTLIEEVKL